MGLSQFRISLAESLCYSHVLELLRNSVRQQMWLLFKNFVIWLLGLTYKMQLISG
jgi:hypothetical protein